MNSSSIKLLFFAILLFGYAQPVPSQVQLGEKQVIEFRRKILDIQPAGAGKYLLLTINQFKELAIVDVTTQKVIGNIPLDSDKVAVGGGLTKIVIVDFENGKISRWDIATQKQEQVKSFELPGKEKEGQLLIGSATNGPAILSIKRERRSAVNALLNVGKLTMTQITNDRNQIFGLGNNAKISSNGKTIVAANYDYSHSYTVSLYRSRGSWQIKKEYNLGNIAVSPDGEFVLTQKYGPLYKSLSLSPPNRKPLEGFPPLLFPAASGPFYLSHPFTNFDKESRSKSDDTQYPTQIFAYGKKQPLAKIDGLERIYVETFRGLNAGLPLNKRVWFLPNHGQIILVGEDQYKLNCYPLDFEKLLAQSGTEVLAVTSRPKTNIKAGQEFEYQVEAKSKSRKIQYSLDLAPKGMTITSTGKIRWKTSTDSPRKNKVIVALKSDSGTQAFHTFDLDVEGGIGADVARMADGPKAKKVPAVTLCKFFGNQVEMELPGMFTEMKVGGAGRYLLLKMNDLKKIAIVDICERKIVGYLPLPDEKSTFAVSYDKVVVFDSTQGTATRYNLTDQSKELTAKTWFNGIVSQAAMGANSNGPALLRWSQSTRGRCSFEFMDLNTLKKVDVSWPYRFLQHESYHDKNYIRASLNGKKFAIGEIGPLKLEENRAMLRDISATLTPSADGQFFAGDRVYDFEDGGRNVQVFRSTLLLPSVTGNFYLTYSNKKLGTEIGVFGRDETIGEGPPLRTIATQKLDDFFAFVPNAKVVIEVPTIRNKLLFRRVDAEAAVAKLKPDYLYIASSPPPTTKVGESYEYRIDVKSKVRIVDFKIASGPIGMKIDSSGKVTWKPDASAFPENFVVVDLTAENRKTASHTFKVDVAGGQGREKIVVTPSSSIDKPVELTPSAIGNKSRMIQLPTKFGRIKIGGNGRYLCVHLPDIRKIAIVDVCLAKITGYLSLESDSAIFSASRNKIVVVDSAKGLISRWNLESRTKELEKSFPLKDLRADRCEMGQDSIGPLLVRAIDDSIEQNRREFKFYLFDLDTLKLITADKAPTGAFAAADREDEEIFVSEDGSEFAIDDVGSIRIDSGQVKLNRDHSDIIRRPAQNGRYVRKNEILSGQLPVITIPDTKYLIPVYNSPYFIALPGNPPRLPRYKKKFPSTPIEPRFHVLGESRPIAKLKSVSLSSIYPPEQSLILIPRAKVLATSNLSRTAIELQPFDVEKIVAASNVEFLTVSSSPTDTRLKMEQKFDYQVMVNSKNGGLKFSLISSPEGMTVSNLGHIEWVVPKSLKVANPEVIVSIEDSKNQKVFHKFRLFVPEVTDIVRKQRMEQRQENEVKIMTERNKTAIKEFKAKLQVAKAGQDEPEGLTEYKDNPNEVRKWTDRSGEHQIQAKFVRVDNRTELVLIADDGRIRTLPLNRLSSKDVYAAVELEVKRTKNAKEGKENTEGVSLSAKTRFEIYRDVNLMVDSFDQLDVKEWYESVYHPDCLKAHKESGRLQKLTDYNKMYLYSNLLRIDLNNAKQRDEYLSVRTVGLKKHGDRWYVFIK